MGPFAETLAAALCDDDSVAPGAKRLAVGGDRRWFANEHHILLQRDGELARASGMGRDDRTVVAGAATMHVQIAARTGCRTTFRRRGSAGLESQFGKLFD